MALVACGDDRPPAAGPSSSATTHSSSATRGPKTIVFDKLTFHAPASWGIDIEGDTAFIGVLAGGPHDVQLRVERNFDDSIESLKPGDCPREGDPPEAATSVVTLESGFRPVGNKRAEYRLWRVSCATVRDHRAWLLPAPKIAIYEQVGRPENVDVVTTAEVG